MPLSTILIVVLILFLIGTLPTWPHSKSWDTGQVAATASEIFSRLMLLPDAIGRPTALSRHYK